MKKLAILTAVAALAAFGWTPITQGAPFDTFVVNDGGDDCGSLVADFAVIQDAIGAASDTTKLNKRDVILVCPGTYAENVVVDKTVILQGVGGPVGYAIVDATGDTITIMANGVKIDNLEITNGGTAGSVVVVNSDGNEISHNWITGAQEGILIGGGLMVTACTTISLEPPMAGVLMWITAVATIFTTTPYPGLAAKGLI